MYAPCYTHRHTHTPETDSNKQNTVRIDLRKYNKNEPIFC